MRNDIAMTCFKKSGDFLQSHNCRLLCLDKIRVSLTVAVVEACVTTRPQMVHRSARRGADGLTAWSTRFFLGSESERWRASNPIIIMRKQGFLRCDKLLERFLLFVRKVLFLLGRCGYCGYDLPRLPQVREEFAGRQQPRCPPREVLERRAAVGFEQSWVS